jgi:cytochrome oxidase Cu insertion factor (SCO1/SenC/PrrC family)
MSCRPGALLAALVVVTLTAIPGHAVDQALGPKDGTDLSPTDLERVRPGEPAPDFTLEDQNGRSVTLSAFCSQRPVVLVFYRGHW